METTARHSDQQSLGSIEFRRAASLYLPALWTLYAVLLAAYFAVRFSWLGSDWPSQQALEIEPQLATMATIGLSISSVTVALATRAQRSGSEKIAKSCLILTASIGIGFVAIQANEYRRRWQQNLIPRPALDVLHDRPDLHYLSAVHRHLVYLASTINASKVQQNQLSDQLQNLPENLRSSRPRLEAELAAIRGQESRRAERLATINRLMVSEDRWSSLVVATSDDSAIQRMAIASLAYDVRPHSAFTQLHKEFRRHESQRLVALRDTAQRELTSAQSDIKQYSEPIRPLLSAFAEAKAEKQELESLLKERLRQLIVEQEQATEQIIDPEKNGDPKQVEIENTLEAAKRKFAEREEKLSIAARLVTNAEDRASQYTQELNNIADRQAMIAELDAGQGLNVQHSWMRLPICIPGGNAWAISYFALTGLHAAHITSLITMILATIAAPKKVNSISEPAANPIVGNWHSATIIWFMLYALIYLI